MTKQQTIEFYQAPSQSQPRNVSEEPLQLDEMLSLIKRADDLGYSVKEAREMKSLYDVISSELYAVWFAIENNLPIFTHNVLDLIEFTGWQRRRSSSTNGENQVEFAVA